MLLPSFVIFLSYLALGAAELAQQPLSVAPEEIPWEVLRAEVGDRLFAGTPFANACFGDALGAPAPGNASACSAVQKNYLDELTRTNAPGAYINSQWETCQASGEQCLLDFSNPHSRSPIASPHTCDLGSVPKYFIEVKGPEDVAAAFKFSASTKVPLTIKNTGHDYKGRSSAPGSLALWTHNLKNISYNADFIPEGCTESSPAVTMGAGVQWGQAYDFAEANNITVVGGSDLAVGAAGGWLQGGGHGALSNTMGMGVDRVLEYKVVTPDGKYRTVNSCQNQDLFFALRGGGGGTFGVVLEATILASPPVQLEVVIVSWTKKDPALSKSLFSIMAANGLKWAKEGWGGYGTAETAIYVNPKISKEDAAKSMAPLVAFGEQLKADKVLGAQLMVAQFPTWGAFFKSFTSVHVAVVGSSLALTSRLVNKSNFATNTAQSDLVSALLAAEAAAPGLIILISPPSTFTYVPGATSVTEQWRESIYHVTVVSQWNWNATKEEKAGNYTLASQAIDNLRRITPDAAYLNEADVYEPHHEVAFWGTNYPKLLEIKQRYDPDHLLDCWQCVGWSRNSSQFSCYL